MHLRKDRVRPMRKSIAIQTDPYFQFPPLQKLTPGTSRKSVALGVKSIKRMNSFPRGASEHRSTYDNHHFRQSNGNGVDGVFYNKNRTHSNSIGRNRLTESNQYSESEDMTTKTQRPSRHSQFMEQSKLRHKQRNYRHNRGDDRRESSRYSNSTSTHRYTSRNRTLSSSSSSSDSSTAESVSSSMSSSSSSSSSTSKSSSSSYISASPRSLNSYGGSSSKSTIYYDDHPYSQKRTTSRGNTRSKANRRHSTARKHRSNSPGL